MDCLRERPAASEQVRWLKQASSERERARVGGEATGAGFE